mmetsp:Transcript_93039/g.194429  ORF Transcript_93039/g.194429 Transcript_93039/m.194429 type:complete len:374 (+) Transcript_93039:2153-3274(+)
MALILDCIRKNKVILARRTNLGPIGVLNNGQAQLVAVHWLAFLGDVHLPVELAVGGASDLEVVGALGGRVAVDAVAHRASVLSCVESFQEGLLLEPVDFDIDADVLVVVPLTAMLRVRHSGEDATNVAFAGRSVCLGAGVAVGFDLRHVSCKEAHPLKPFRFRRVLGVSSVTLAGVLPLLATERHQIDAISLAAGVAVTLVLRAVLGPVFVGPHLSALLAGASVAWSGTGRHIRASAEGATGVSDAVVDVGAACGLGEGACYHAHSRVATFAGCGAPDAEARFAGVGGSLLEQERLGVGDSVHIGGGGSAQDGGASRSRSPSAVRLAREREFSHPSRLTRCGVAVVARHRRRGRVVEINSGRRRMLDFRHLAA